MTIAERIQLHKLGYTKEEIKELANADYKPEGLTNPPVEKPVENVETEPETVVSEIVENIQKETEKDTAAEILKAIQNLTDTIQQSNIRQSRQPEPPAESAEVILSTLL